MKDPEEYFDKIPYDFRVPNAKEWICEQILNAQKDAYNQAIEDAIDAEWRQHNGIEFTDEEMRAKLKIK